VLTVEADQRVTLAPEKEEIKVELTIEELIEQKAIEYGVNPDMAKKIAWCESRYKQSGVGINYRTKSVQVGTTTQVVRYEHSRDYGIFQLNSVYQLPRAEVEGLNVHTLEGNLQFGLELMKSEGAGPWRASAHCHGYY